MLKNFSFLSVFIFSSIAVDAFAELDNSKACIKYQRADYSWSRGYSVRGFFINGSELNVFARKNGYESNNKSNTIYFVVPWKQGGYTSLDIGRGFLYSYEEEVRDQNAKKWKIKKGWDRCN